MQQTESLRASPAETPAISVDATGGSTHLVHIQRCVAFFWNISCCRLLQGFDPATEAMPNGSAAAAPPAGLPSASAAAQPAPPRASSPGGGAAERAPRITRRSGSPRVGPLGAAGGPFGGAAGGSQPSSPLASPQSPIGGGGGTGGTPPFTPSPSPIAEGRPAALAAGNGDSATAAADTVATVSTGGGGAAASGVASPEPDGRPQRQPPQSGTVHTAANAEDQGAKEAIAALDALLAAHGVPGMRREPPPGLFGAAA